MIAAWRSWTDWPAARHPVFYLKSHGQGAVLYLTLGHCRGHYDLQPLMEYWPTVDRCAWDLPVFHELLRRGVQWAKEPIDGDHALRVVSANVLELTRLSIKRPDPAPMDVWNFVDGNGKVLTETICVIDPPQSIAQIRGIDEPTGNVVWSSWHGWPAVSEFQRCSRHAEADAN